MSHSFPYHASKASYAAKPAGAERNRPSAGKGKGRWPPHPVPFLTRSFSSGCVFRRDRQHETQRLGQRRRAGLARQWSRPMSRHLSLSRDFEQTQPRTLPSLPTSATEGPFLSDLGNVNQQATGPFGNIHTLFTYRILCLMVNEFEKYSAT